MDLALLANLLTLATSLAILVILLRRKTMAALDDLTAAVTGLETASANAITEITTLKSSDNETALEALAGRVNTVAANLTAAAPTPATGA